MEIDQIETFLAVLTYGGFHRAAAALNISQPAVSARVRALEDGLGVKLFARVRGNLSVSPAGRRCVLMLNNCCATSRGRGRWSTNCSHPPAAP